VGHRLLSGPARYRQTGDDQEHAEQEAEGCGSLILRCPPRSARGSKSLGQEHRLSFGRITACRGSDSRFESRAKLPAASMTHIRRDSGDLGGFVREDGTCLRPRESKLNNGRVRRRGGVSVPSGKAPRGPQVPLARRDAVFLPVKTF